MRAIIVMLMATAICSSLSCGKTSTTAETGAGASAAAQATTASEYDPDDYDVKNPDASGRPRYRGFFERHYELTEGIFVMFVICMLPLGITGVTGINPRNFTVPVGVLIFCLAIWFGVLRPLFGDVHPGQPMGIVVDLVVQGFWWLLRGMPHEV